MKLQTPSGKASALGAVALLNDAFERRREDWFRHGDGTPRSLGRALPSGEIIEIPLWPHRAPDGPLEVNECVIPAARFYIIAMRDGNYQLRFVSMESQRVYAAWLGEQP